MDGIASAKKNMRHWLEEHSPSVKGVVVGCSGGLDSCVLLALLADLREELGGELAVAHVNYGLRGVESDGDQAFVENLAAQLGLTCHVLKVTASERQKRQGEGIQEWARRIRREWFQSFAEQGWVIALAHHQNDLAETALLRLARGAGVGQLAGMGVWVSPYWRPLLNLAKDELSAWADRQKLLHRHDSSNDKLIYSRNRVRHNVLTELEHLYPGATQRIAHLALEARDLARYCQTSLDEALQKQGDSLQGSWLRELPPGVALEALSRFIGARVPEPIELSRSVLYQALAALEQTPSRSGHWGVELAGRGYLQIADDQVRVSCEERPLFPARAQQHERNLLEKQVNMILEPQATGELVGSRESTGLALENCDLGVSHKISFVTVKANETLMFHGDDRNWHSKKLFRRWEVAELPEKVYKKIYHKVWIDERLTGLYDGRFFVRPGRTGLKVLSHSCIKMRS